MILTTKIKDRMLYTEQFNVRITKKVLSAARKLAKRKKIRLGVIVEEALVEYMKPKE